MNGKSAIIVLITAAIVMPFMYWLGTRKSEQTQMPPTIHQPTIFALDTTNLKTTKEVIEVLDALGVRMSVDLSMKTPEVEKFKKAQKFFKLAN